MNDFIQERKSLVILLIVILFLLLGLIYFYKVKPLKDDENFAKSSIQQLESEIQILQAQLDSNQPDPTDRDENQYLLERKMPLDRSIDDLILSLQEIEMVSESRIENISFNNYDGGLSEADQVIEREEEEEAAEEDVDETEGDEAAETENLDIENFEETTEPPVSDVADHLPTNVKLITVNLSVISPNFEKFELFLKEIEKLERITRVDTLSFSKPGEEELLSTGEEADEAMITTNVQITTFYYDENATSVEE